MVNGPEPVRQGSHRDSSADAAVTGSRTGLDSDENIVVLTLGGTGDNGNGSDAGDAAIIDVDAGHSGDIGVNGIQNLGHPVGLHRVKPAGGIGSRGACYVRVGDLAIEGVVAVSVKSHDAGEADGAADCAGGLIQLRGDYLADEKVAVQFVIPAGVEVLRGGWNCCARAENEKCGDFIYCHADGSAAIIHRRRTR